MARPLRIEYPGAWYHVMNRGAGQREVFKTERQREYFLGLLNDTTNRFQAEWHAYCLMGNHYHLLIRTPQGNLQRIMRHVDGLYTQFFNRTEDRDGPLFRGRYRAVLVDADTHWLELSRYIHRNPLEAGLTNDLKDYRWSSYQVYAGLKTRPPWLITEYVLKAIGERDQNSRYRTFVTGDTDKELRSFYEQTRMSPILGDERFRAQALAGKERNINHPDLRVAKPLPSLEKIVAVTCRRLKVSDEEIWKSRRGRAAGSPARVVAMYLCQRIGGMTLPEIATAFALDSYAGAGAVIRKLKRRLQSDLELDREVKLMILDLTP